MFRKFENNLFSQNDNIFQIPNQNKKNIKLTIELLKKSEVRIKQLEKSLSKLTFRNLIGKVVSKVMRLKNE